MKTGAQKGLEVVYARAVGRGKTAEADAVWGEGVAMEAIMTGSRVLNEPSDEGVTREGRLGAAYLLAFPLFIAAKLEGALVFVRFGGPRYSDLHIEIASLQAFWAAALIERRDLQEARAELDSVQRQMRLQDDFVSTISHELRTPLGFIKGYSTSLLREDTVWDDATRSEFLTIIDEEADHLTRLDRGHARIGAPAKQDPAIQIFPGADRCPGARCGNAYQFASSRN